MSGPLSFVLPQSRRSISVPGAPTTPPMPSDFYPSVPSAIKIPQLLETNSGSNENSAVGAPAMRDGGDDEQRAEYNGMNGSQFLNSHLQPLGYGMQGQVPNFTAAGGDIHVSIPFRHSTMPFGFLTMFVRIAEFYIPSARPAGTRDCEAPTARALTACDPQRAIDFHWRSSFCTTTTIVYSLLFFALPLPSSVPGSFSPPSVQSPGGLKVSGQRTVPQGLPHSPEPSTADNE